MPSHWAHSFVCTCLVGLGPATAFAQAATPLDRFDPAPAGDGSFAVPRANITGHLHPSASLVVSYAHAPLRLRTVDVASGQTTHQANIVSHQLITHVLASLEVLQVLKLDVDVPFTMSQGGDSPRVDPRAASIPGASPQSFVSPNGVSMNDIRLGARLALVPQRGHAPAASVAYAVWFPSGNDQAYTSTGFFRHAPSLIVGTEQKRYAWSVMAGRRVQNSNNDAGLIGSEVFGGARVAVLLDKLTLHGELFGSVITADKSAVASSTPSAELLAGARYTFGRISTGVMGGPGLSRGIGTPSFRLLVTVGVNFESVDPAKSNARNANAGVQYAKTTDTGAPSSTPKKTVLPANPAAADRDADTVADQSDACPDIGGDPSPTATRRGCPPDRDGDAIADRDDRCPDEKGVATPDLSRFGCPLDSDGDGFNDAFDACPNEKGAANADPKLAGCPRSVRVEGTQIVILNEVNFATGSDVLTTDSFPVLTQVAEVLAQHPEIARLAVDGHTDNAGAEKSNVTLSQKRAVAVVAWLVEHGIDARRLEARGFGPRRPLASNDTPAGMAKNRRVEFQIVKRSAEGAASWRAGSVQ